MAAPLPRSVALGYGLGSMGTGMYATVPGLLLLYYMTDVLGIGAGLAGLAIFVPRMWDVISDPLMGSISDRTRSRWGRRRPYLLAGGLTLPVFFGFLFSAPQLSPGAAFAFTMVMYALCATAFTVFQVPYIAMPAEMTDDYHETTRLMAYRMALMTVGILIAGAGAPMVIKAVGGGRAGYSAMSWAIAGLCLLAMLGSFWGTRRARFTAEDAPERGPRLLQQIALALRNRPFRVLVGAYALQLCAVGSLLATVAYFAEYVIGGGEETVTLLFLALMLPAIVTMPLWLALSRRLGKERCFSLALVLFTAGAVCLWWSPAMSLTVAASLVGVMGIAYAATQLFPYSMLPDTIALDRKASGRSREGIFTGIWTAVDKGGLALGGFATGLILEFSGFIERHGEAAITQPASALRGIVVAMSLVPALLTLASWAIYRRYDLGEASLAAEGAAAAEGSP
jgi:GPH family glycoside/pentoside/hexuronide:cation symporter